jgi:hypothetical protein
MNDGNDGIMPPEHPPLRASALGGRTGGIPQNTEDTEDTEDIEDKDIPVPGEKKNHIDHQSGPAGLSRNPDDRDDRGTHGNRDDRDDRDDRDTPRISIGELESNPDLAHRILVSLWRDGLADKRFRFLILRDLAEMISVYGLIEPFYSIEAAARLCGMNRELLKYYLRKYSADIRDPYYVLRSFRGRGMRQKVRFLYASDIQKIREKMQRKGPFATGKYGPRARAAYHRQRASRHAAADGGSGEIFGVGGALEG